METEIYDMDPAVYSKLMNFHFAQILDSSTKVSLDQYNYAQNWTEQNWHLKSPCIVKTLDKR